jgi:DNA repair protein SbcC/Rad50
MVFMITKIALKNWKSHEDTSLSFGPGTNGLVGINGSGKTSILDAICFALFGTFPKLQVKKLKVEDLIMNKPKAKEKAEVEVEFDFGGKHYSVKRMIERGRGTSYSEIKEDGRMIESPSTKLVTENVEKVLKCNYELFSKAVYSEQNSIDYFLTISKGQRMSKIDELLMIDKFEDARKAAVSLRTKVADTKVGKQSVVERYDMAKTAVAIDEARAFLEKSKSEEERLKYDMQRLAGERSRLEKDAAGMRMIKENLEAIRLTDRGLESSISTTVENIESISKKLKDASRGIDMYAIDSMLVTHGKNIEAESQKIAQKQSEYEGLQREIAKSRATAEMLQKDRIQRLEKEFKEKMAMKAELDHIRDTSGGDVVHAAEESRAALDSLIGELESARTKVADLQEQMDQVSQAKGTCPLCGSPIAEEKKKMIVLEKRRDLEKLSARIENARAERSVAEGKLRMLESAAKRLEQIMKEISDMDSVRAELDASNRQLMDHIGMVERVGQQLDAMKFEMDSMRKKLEQAQGERQKMMVVQSQADESSRLKQKAEQLKAQRDALKGEISRLESGFNSKILEEVELALRKVAADLRGAEVKLDGLVDGVRERKSQLADMEIGLERMKKEKMEIERLEALAKDLSIFVDALRHTQVELRKEFVEAVNFTMNSMWQILYPYQNFIGVRLGVEEGDYVLQLQERTLGWVDAEGTPSGGERSIACLALRIAFSRVLAPHLRMMVLDEPTANLDSNSVKLLAETLRENIADIVEQGFIVTHDETFEEAVTGTAYRLERDKQNDGVTKAIQIA